MINLYILVYVFDEVKFFLLLKLIYLIIKIFFIYIYLVYILLRLLIRIDV